MTHRVELGQHVFRDGLVVVDGRRAPEPSPSVLVVVVDVGGREVDEQLDQERRWRQGSSGRHRDLALAVVVAVVDVFGVAHQI